MDSNRPYLSYSQYALFKSSPKTYFEKYVLDKKNRPSKYQRFGKKLMEDLEFNELENVPKELRQIIINNDVEKEITVRPKFFDKDLFSIIDVCSDEGTHFYEIKTGKHAWSEAKVLKDEQMLFYALTVSLKYKVIPTSTLIWVETEDAEDGSIKFTGKIQKFKREFTLGEIEDFEKTLLETCVAISEYEHSIVDFDNSVDARLLRLMSEKKRIDSELDLLKAEILIEIKEIGDKYATSENFDITLAKRTNYAYSEDISKSVEEFNKVIKLKKIQEEKSGIAIPSITEYLLIKPKK